MIPKKIHLTWKTRDLMNIKNEFLDKTVNGFVNYSPNWEIEVSDDSDVDSYLRKYLSKNDYSNLQDRSIIEKIDVWRLIKMYNEGGLYVDIDRLCNKSLDDIICKKTRLVLPTCADHDFSHDFMCSSPGNPIFLETLKLNLSRRSYGENNIYFLGPQTYLHGIMIAMIGQIEPRFSVSQLREMLTKTDFCITMKELPPFKTIIYDGDDDFDHEKEKRQFYKESGLKHWTNDW